MNPGRSPPSFLSLVPAFPLFPFPLTLTSGLDVLVRSKYVCMHFTASRSVVVLSIFRGIFLSLTMDSKIISSSKYWFIITRRRCSLSFLPRLGMGENASSVFMEEGEEEEVGEGERVKWAIVERCLAIFRPLEAASVLFDSAMSEQRRGGGGRVGGREGGREGERERERERGETGIRREHKTSMHQCN